MDLRSKIDSKGLKHSWVADKIGIHKTALSHYLSNLRPMPDEVKSKILELTK